MSTNLPNQTLNKLAPKLKAKSIEIKIGDGYQQEYIDGLGYLPFLWYNSFPIELSEIEFLELAIVDGIPTLKSTFKDGTSIMRDRGFPLDDTRISIFLHPRSTQLKPIHLDFKIVDFKMFDKTFTCVGVLDVNKLYVKEFKSYKNLSSFEALKKVCDEIGFGFNSNIDNSNDKMTWINTGEKVRHFVDKIIDNAFLSDQSFLLGYFDYYYNYNYVDLQKELTRNINEELGIQDNGIENIVKIEDKEKLSRLALTNDVGFVDGNMYFEKFTVLNKSTGISIDKGYKSIIKYYNQLSKEYLFFNLDSITDNSNSKIILKGKPKDTKFKNENFDYVYKGKLDSDNMHINYAYAQLHNDRNLFDLEKIGLELTMRIPNFNLYKFQKVLVLISNQAKGVVDEFYNRRLSGEWLIIDIKFRLNNGRFNQILTLVKRELELSKNEVN
jgi:hypothetical protein